MARSVPLKSYRAFGSVRQRASGRWQATYRLDGIEHTAPMTFATKTQADTWLNNQRTDIARGEWVDPRSGSIPFDEWADEWLRGRSKRPSTTRRDQGYVDRYLKAAFGDMALGDITYRHIVQWKAELLEGLAPSTVRTALVLLTSVLESAVQAQLLPSNPAGSVERPEVVIPEMRFLTPDEVTRLAAAMDKRYKGVVWLGSISGMRASEMFGLKWEQVNLKKQLVNVRWTLVEVEGHLHEGPPKTKAGIRTVPITSKVVDALKPAGRGWVFTAPEGGPVRLANWRYRFWEPAVRKAKLGNVRIHDLRHTAVSLWIASEMHVKEVSRRAGHASTSFTLDRYGHLLPGLDEKANRALDELF